VAELLKRVILNIEVENAVSLHQGGAYRSRLRVYRVYCPNDLLERQGEATPCQSNHQQYRRRRR